MRRRFVQVALGLAFAMSMLSPADAQTRRVQVMAGRTSYSVETIERDGIEYVGLIELLEPLGKIEAKRQGDSWRLSFRNSRTVDADFHPGKSKGTINGKDIDLGGAFALISSRGYIPVRAVGTLLPRLLEQPVQWKSPSHRLYIGVQPIKLTLDLHKNPSSLAANFSSPVTPQISSEGTTVRLVFHRDPLLLVGPEKSSYGDPVIASSTFNETASGAELIVRGSVPLRADVGEGGKTITISASNPQGQPQLVQANAAHPQTPSQPTPTQQQAATPPQPKPLPTSSSKGFVVVIDPAHGGLDTGAKLSDNLLEKDVTIAFARRIAHELQQRGVNATLLRAGDMQLSAEQRSTAANGAMVRVFISVHASSLGHGMRVFTALMPPSAAAKSRRSFLEWDTAQSAYLENSAQLAGAISAECNKRKLEIRALTATVPPLTNIVAPAVAVELAPQDNISSLTTNSYQQSYAAAIAAAVIAMRPQGEPQ